MALPMQARGPMEKGVNAEWAFAASEEEDYSEEEGVPGSEEFEGDDSQRSGI